MTPRPFVVRERVRWSDCDPMGIIRYDAYTRFFELGESEMFHAVGVGYHDLGRRFGISLPRRVMHMEYPSPPALDEVLEVEVYVSGVGSSSLTLRFDAYGDGGVLRMAGHLVLVCVEDDPARTDKRTIRKTPLPAAFVTLLAPHRLSVEEARRAHLAVSA